MRGTAGVHVPRGRVLPLRRVALVLVGDEGGKQDEWGRHEKETSGGGGNFRRGKWEPGASY